MMKETNGVKAASHKALSLVDNLSSKEWLYIHKRMRSPFYTHFLFKGVSQHLNSNVNFPYEISVLYLDGHIGFPQEEWERLRSIVNEELELNKQFLLQLLNDSYVLNERIEMLSKRLEKLDFRIVSKNVLATYWIEYTTLMYQFGAYVLPPLFVEQDLEDQLRQYLSKEFKSDEVEKAFQILTTPMKSGVIQRQEENLLQLAIAKSNGEDIKKGLQKHIRNFAWIKNNKYDGVYYSEREIEERIENMLSGDPEEKYETYIKKINNATKQFDLYQDKLKGDEEAIALIDTLQESIYFRSWRTERYYRNAYFLRSFFAKTAEILGLPNENDLFFLTPDEIVASLNNEKIHDMQQIEKRKEGYICFADLQTTVIYSGQICDEFKKSINLFDKETGQEVRGQAAYLGKVSGVARVVTSISEFNKIQDGDILITNSTTPDFAPMLKKVRAIVAEEGGVLSHASVIARELHIPCIIGTKNATQVLKDGVMVEVDANNGIIRILNN